MNPGRTGGGAPTSIDYALGQIDTKLTIISTTLSEDRLSDAQFRTWVREKIEKLEKDANTAEGNAQAWRALWGFIQFAIGLVGGSVVVLIERWFHSGAPKP
jgi:hypothetical protein